MSIHTIVRTAAPPVARHKPREIRAHTALRGVAALLVVAYHLQFGAAHRFTFERATSFFTRSYLFVDLFFILSGFIISYVNAADRPDPPTRAEVSRFAIGRFARLYPLHLFCLAYLVLWQGIASLLWYSAGRDPSGLWVAHARAVLGVQALLLNAFVPGFDGWNSPTWSISAEIAAYLAFPALVALHARRRWLALAALLAIPCLYYGAAVAWVGTLDITTGYGWMRALAGFMLGMALFYARGGFARLSARVLGALQLLALGLIIGVLIAPLPDPLVMLPFLLLVGATWTDRGAVSTLLGARPLQWLGEHSFSIYLNHVPVGVILIMLTTWSHVEERVPPAPFRGVTIALVYGLTLAVSAFTYRHVERPARAWLLARLSNRRVRPIEESPSAP